MGVVFRAQDPLGRVVALKLLQGALASPRHQRRFEKEVRALLRVRHPHVVGLLDAGSYCGAPYVVLEWVDGESLQDRLDRAGALPPATAALLVERLAQAVARCHAEGVLHRDIKPANVLLRREDDVPLLADFGLAKEVDPHGVSRGVSAAMTAEGAPLGTPGFWAPEQARGELERVGPPADVYGLGATLYAALTGSSPYRARDLIGLYQAMEQLPAPPSSLAPRVPARLDAICLRCLAPEPEDRYPDAATLAVDLHAFASGQAEPARRRGRIPVALAATFAVALGGAALLLRREPPAPAPAPAPAPPPAPAPAPARPAPPPPVDPERRRAAQDEVARSRGLYQSGRQDLALAALDHALELDPGLAEAWRTRSALRAAQGDLAGAEEDLDHALEANPVDVHAWRNRGIVRGRRGRLEESEADLTRALELERGTLALWRDRAITRFRRGNARGSEEDLNQALALSPDDPDLLYNRGVARSALGQHEAARADFERALRQGFPERARGLAGLADEQLILGDADGAVASLDEALALGVTAELHLQRAAARLEQRNLVGALEDCAAARARAPALPGLAEIEARIHLRGGQPRQALEVCDRQLRRNPEDGPAWLGRGLALASLGDREQAATALERFLELAPNHPEAPHARRELKQLRAAPPGG